MARRETGCSSHRNALRRTMAMATAGITSQSGTRIAVPRLVAMAGTNAAQTTSAIQRTATALRLRGDIFTGLILRRSKVESAALPIVTGSVEAEGG